MMQTGAPISDLAIDDSTRYEPSWQLEDVLHEDDETLQPICPLARSILDEVVAHRLAWETRQRAQTEPLSQTDRSTSTPASRSRS